MRTVDFFLHTLSVYILSTYPPTCFSLCLLGIFPVQHEQIYYLLSCSSFCSFKKESAKRVCISSILVGAKPES